LADGGRSITSEVIGAQIARRLGSVDDGDPIIYEIGVGRGRRGANSILTATATV